MKKIGHRAPTPLSAFARQIPAIEASTGKRFSRITFLFVIIFFQY
jgi:hypothetical protein